MQRSAFQSSQNVYDVGLQYEIVIISAEVRECRQISSESREIITSRICKTISKFKGENDEEPIIRNLLLIIFYQMYDIEHLWEHPEISSTNLHSK